MTPSSLEFGSSTQSELASGFSLEALFQPSVKPPEQPGTPSETGSHYSGKAGFTSPRK